MSLTLGIPMTTIEQVGILTGATVSVIAIVRAGFAVSAFFADLASSLKALTDAVKQLTVRLDEHRSEFTDLRERVAALESWREDVQA